jgi:hypothetical protein
MIDINLSALRRALALQIWMIGLWIPAGKGDVVRCGEIQAAGDLDLAFGDGWLVRGCCWEEISTSIDQYRPVYVVV